MPTSPVKRGDAIEDKVSKKKGVVYGVCTNDNDELVVDVLWLGMSGYFVDYTREDVVIGQKKPSWRFTEKPALTAVSHRVLTHENGEVFAYPGRRYEIALLWQVPRQRKKIAIIVDELNHMWPNEVQYSNGVLGNKFFEIIDSDPAM